MTYGTIYELLKRAGSRGIVFNSNDKNLSEIRSAVQQLRDQKIPVREDVVAAPYATPHTYKRIRFTLKEAL